MFMVPGIQVIAITQILTFLIDYVYHQSVCEGIQQPHGLIDIHLILEDPY